MAYLNGAVHVSSMGGRLVELDFLRTYQPQMAADCLGVIIPSPGRAVTHNCGNFKWVKTAVMPSSSGS